MIQEARYTSPSGQEAVFAWEIGKRKTTLKTGVYTFPGRDGAHVQHQGAGARAFPLVCIFSGPDCMEEADTFEAMLIERGAAELQHPIYGAVKVVPTGDIEREDDPVNKNGESTVSITFTETISDEDAAGLNEVAAEAVDEKFEEFSEASAADFAETITAAEGDLNEQLAITAALEAQTQAITDSLEPLAKADKKKFADWIASAKELKDNIKNLYKKGLGYAAKAESLYVKALNIGRLTLRLLKLPSDLAVSLAEKIKGYATLTANLINQYKNDPFGVKKIENAYATAKLAITGAVAAIASGSALTVAEIAALTGAAPAAASSRSAVSGSGVGGASSGGATPGSGPGAGSSGGGGSTGGGGGSGGGLSGGGGVPGGGSSGGASASGNTPGGGAVNKSAGTTSRAEAVEAANTIAAFLETATEFQDTKIAQNAFVDTDTAAALALNELVYASIQLILNASFALPLQRTITLDRDRQAIELCAELYGSTDYLDDFIIENNFNIDEIELLPMGKRVSYYVKST